VGSKVTIPAIAPRNAAVPRIRSLVNAARTVLAGSSITGLDGGLPSFEAICLLPFGLPRGMEARRGITNRLADLSPHDAV